MDIAALTPVVVVLVLGAISPGPSLAVLLRNTIEGGKSRGVACGLGHGIGFGIYAFVAIAGIAQLKSRASGAAHLLEIAGAIFLLILAALMLRGEGEDSKPKNSERRGFSEGFLISFLNPKILVFLIAIFSQFIQPDFTWTERALVAGIAMIIDGGWYILVALVISGTPILESLQRNGRKVELAMGMVLAALGIWILL